jgi:hypothetical protein
MRNILLNLFAFVVMMGAFSCADENIGASILDTESDVIQDSTFVMTGKSVLNSKVLARTSTQLLGQVNSPGFGQVTSDVVTELMPVAVIDTVGTRRDWIDSCRLVLRIPEGGFTGDSIVPMRLNVYALNKQLSSPIYSDFNPTGYYDPTQVLGSISYSVKSAERFVSSSMGDSPSVWREIFVPMPVAYAQSIRDLYVTNSDVFRDPAEFKKHFPGLYITNSFGSGRVMNFVSTELEVFYKKREKLENGTDTIYPAIRQSYVGSTPEVLTNNNIKLEIDDDVKKLVDNGDAIVMGPAGYEVMVHFPIQEIIDKFKSSTADALAVVNSLSLEIPAETIDNKYDIAPPKYLLLVKEGKKDEFFAGDSLVNNKNSFYATYNKAKKSYSFNGMREYIIDILDNKGGIATSEDINLILTPVDVTTYTQQASYYSSASTVVTKIAPSVTLPSIAKLRLDKAKIKIVYSRQSIF